MSSFQHWLVAAAGAACMAAVPAQAATSSVNFDDIPVPDYELLADGYAGFHWDNWGVTVGHNDIVAGSGYEAVARDSRNVAYNAAGNLATFSRDQAFTLQSFDLAAAWNDGVNVTVTGRLGDTVVGTRSFQLSTHAPTTFNFGWTVDSVSMVGFGGTSAGYSGNYAGTQLAFDNLTVSSPVPEPQTYVMLALGLVGIMVFKRSRV